MSERPFESKSLLELRELERMTLEKSLDPYTALENKPDLISLRTAIVSEMTVREGATRDIGAAGQIEDTAEDLQSAANLAAELEQAGATEAADRMRQAIADSQRNLETNTAGDALFALEQARQAEAFTAGKGLATAGQIDAMRAQLAGMEGDSAAKRYLATAISNADLALQESQRQQEGDE